VTTTITVPDLLGRDRNDATEALQRLTLIAGRVQERETNEPRGTVVAQEPAAGTVVGLGATVSFWVAVPVRPVVVQPPPIAVPSVVALTVEQARAVLRARGLRPGNVAQARSTATTGTITSQSPVAGTPVQTGASVDLTVAASLFPGPSLDSSMLPWLLAGALLGLGVAAAASWAKGRHRLASAPVLAPHPDAGFQTSVPDGEALTDFEMSLEARPDHGMQALVYTNRLIAGERPAIR
jgi:hypothetical protein